jgi:membrane associated rhomboid family serine protease
MVAVVSVLFVAQWLSGIWSGNITHLQRPLIYSLHGLSHGQWWRIVTPNLTNGPTWIDIVGPAGVVHLVSNVVGLLVVGPVVERRLGGPRYLALALLAGAVAYGWLVVPLPPADNFDGTSGALYGVIGAAAALTLMRPPRQRAEWTRVSLVALYVLGGVLNQPLITREIHAGGFFAGFVLALVFARFRRPTVVVSTAVGVVVALLVLVWGRGSAISTMDTQLHPRPAASPPG